MRSRPDRRCRVCRAAVERGEHGAAAAAHLRTCAACAGYAERWRAAQDVLRANHARVLPDADFARRVVAGLPQRDDVFVWAALRLLPVAAVVALLLAGAAFELGRTPAGVPGTLGVGVPSDLLTYVALSDSAPGARP